MTHTVGSKLVECQVVHGAREWGWRAGGQWAAEHPLRTLQRMFHVKHHRAGLASFLEVLEARRAADASGERAAAALGRAARARIVLWQALGGEVMASTAPLDQG